MNLTTARAEFEKLCYTWKQYPGAVRVWERNFQHVEQLFEYGSEVRRIMYTTNAIESVNASLRKVTKKGHSPMRQPSTKPYISGSRNWKINGPKDIS